MDVHAVGFAQSPTAELPGAEKMGRLEWMNGRPNHLARYRRLSLFSLLGLALAVSQRGAAEEGPSPATAPAPPFAVVELFTSEGCSSCPAAEAYLGELTREARASGGRVYTLAFHVDYWDYLGWKDPFGDVAHTKRQRAYAKALKAANVYTPQMIVNGVDAFVGSDRRKGRQAIEAALKRSAAARLALNVEQTREGIKVGYETMAMRKTVQLNVALVERGLVTAVGRGENAGRTLHHENVVRAFKSLRLTGDARGSLSLPRPKSLKPEHASVIAFAQEPRSYRIVAATQTDLTGDGKLKAQASVEP